MKTLIFSIILFIGCSSPVEVEEPAMRVSIEVLSIGVFDDRYGHVMFEIENLGTVEVVKFVTIWKVITVKEEYNPRKYGENLRVGEIRLGELFIPTLDEITSVQFLEIKFL